MSIAWSVLPHETPISTSSLEWSGEVQRYLLFRDFLRSNADVRDDYAALKRELSTCDWQDMEEYADAKSSFIEGVIKRARVNDRRGL
jgi:GrpB-like predicted nucleotidyltransferase (UPF0157 family)